MPPITKEELRTAAAGHSVIGAIDTVRRGHLRIETALKYPNGDSIDVFLVEPHGQRPKLSDLGQTTAWLLQLDVRPWQSEKRKSFLGEVLLSLGVRQDGGALEVTDVDLANPMDAILRLAQACLRVSDLMFTRRASLQSAFSERIEEVLAHGELLYEVAPEVEGRFRKAVRVDYRVTSPRVQSLVLTLSSANPSTAHTTANEIFRKWYDLHAPERTEQRVTVIDDAHSYREDDIERLSDESTVVPISDPQLIHDILMSSSA